MALPGVNETFFENPDTTSIFNISFQFIVFCIGLFFQIKIIKACKEEKTKTWQIHIFHSITMTILIPSRVMFLAIGYLSPSVYINIGGWVCHILRFLFCYGYISVLSNSLVIASMKFVLIVHAMKALAFGHSRIQKIFFWANLLFPFILSWDSILPDFQHYGYISKCFNPELWTNYTSENVHSIADGLLKNMIDIDLQERNIVIYIKLVLNIFRVSSIYISTTNVIEAFLYYKIFKFMKR